MLRRWARKVVPWLHSRLSVHGHGEPGPQHPTPVPRPASLPGPDCKDLITGQVAKADSRFFFADLPFTLRPFPTPTFPVGARMFDSEQVFFLVSALMLMPGFQRCLGLSALSTSLLIEGCLLASNLERCRTGKELPKPQIGTKRIRAAKRPCRCLGSGAGMPAQPSIFAMLSRLQGR